MTAEERAAGILWGGRPLPVETRALIADAIREAERTARERCAGLLSDVEAAVRERCAKIADRESDSAAGRRIAEAIRAGEQP